MSTTTEIARNTVVIGDGVVTTIPFQFNFIQDDNQVAVVVTSLDTVTEVQTVLTEGVDYVITGSSIVLSLPLPTGTNLLVERLTEAIQILDYDEDSPFPAEVTEDSMDRVYFAIAELKDLLKRAALLDKFEDPTLRVVIPNPELGKYLAWDGLTGKLVNIDGTADLLTQTSAEVVHNPSDSTLTSGFVKGAIDELDVKAEALNLRVTATEDEIVTIQSDITDIENLLPALNPTGAILMWALGASAPPSGYLYCNGQAVSRTTYAALFSAINTTYGVGDGSTTFNVPNFQGLVPRGIGNQTVNGRVKVGPSLGATQEDQMQRITGSLTGRIPTINGGAAAAAAGAFTKGADEADTMTRVGSATRGISDPTFNSANSPGSRASATTDGETRASALGIGFIIKT